MRRSARMGQLATIEMRCSSRKERSPANDWLEAAIGLSASCHGPGWDRSDWSLLEAHGPGTQQIHFEDVVQLVLAKDLATLAQAGGTHHLQLRSFSQENDPSFSGWFKMNNREGLSEPVDTRGFGLAHRLGRGKSYCCRTGNSICHLGQPFQGYLRFGTLRRRGRSFRLRFRKKHPAHRLDQFGGPKRLRDTLQVPVFGLGRPGHKENRQL